MTNPVISKPEGSTTGMLPTPDNKRKLSVDSEASPAKKTKIDHENGLQR